MPFRTITQGKLEYLTAGNIAVPHCFTTRHGGVSSGSLSSLNLGMHRGDDPANVEENYRILGAALGFDPDGIVMTHQVHSDIVRTVTKEDCGGLDHHAYPECDALITNDPGTVLVAFTADCTPVLLHDPVTGAVGAVHAGWRGTAAGIAGKAVRQMQSQFGCDPKNIRAAIGPNIGDCCFQTDADVPEAMLRRYGGSAKEYIRSCENKFYVNLKKMNALDLRRAGVEQIDISTDCTACQGDRFWSHRRVGADRGAMAAVIICKEAMA